MIHLWEGNRFVPELFSEYWFRFAVVASAIVGFVVWVLYQEAQREALRTETFTRLADELGLSYAEGSDKSLASTLPDFNLFARGRGRSGYAEHVLRARIGDAAVCVFDFTYPGRSPLSGQRHSSVEQTVAYVESDALNLPAFTAGPTKSFERDHLGVPFPVKRIPFPDFDDFSTRYQVSCADEAAVRDVFDEELVSHIEQFTGLDEISLEGRGNAMLLYSWSWPVPASDLREFLERALVFHELLKARSACPG